MKVHSLTITVSFVDGHESGEFKSDIIRLLDIDSFLLVDDERRPRPKVTLKTKNTTPEKNAELIKYLSKYTL